VIKLKPIIPKRRVLDPRAQQRAIDQGMDDAAAGALADFQSTTASWDTQVTFQVKKQADGTRTISTDNTIWLFGDEGTKPHDIVAKKIALRFPGGGFTPKTRPGFIGSSGGGSGGGTPVFRGRVHHPGTKPRGWSKLIGKKWRSRLGPIVQKRINEAMR
jgi:hypothetical protein